jgi:hypothetical protein
VKLPMDSRVEWLRDHVCDSFSVGEDVFNQLVNEAASQKLIKEFLDAGMLQYSVLFVHTFKNPCSCE